MAVCGRVAALAKTPRQKGIRYLPIPLSNNRAALIRAARRISGREETLQRRGQPTYALDAAPHKKQCPRND